MKYSKLFLLLMVFGLFAACEDTNEDLVKQRGVGVVPVMGQMSPALYYATDLESSYVEFDVDLSENDNVESAQIEVVYNDSLSAIVKDLPSLPAKVHLDAVDVFKSLGVDASSVSSNDVLYVYVLTTNNGVTTRSIAADRIKILECAYDEEMACGAYDCVSEDWEAEGNVVLNKVDDYTFEIVGFNENVDGISDYGVNIVLQIDPATFNLANVGESFTISPDLTLDWGDDYAGYTDYTYTIISGSYDTCTGTYEVEFDISVSIGDFGSYKFTFVRL